MQMLRCLFFLEAYCQFTLSAIHLPGVNNDLTDDLSRTRLLCFLQKIGVHQPTETMIPDSLLQWLLHPQMDWPSPAWMQLFSISVTKIADSTHRTFLSSLRRFLCVYSIPFSPLSWCQNQFDVTTPHTSHPRAYHPKPLKPIWLVFAICRLYWGYQNQGSTRPYLDFG